MLNRVFWTDAQANSVRREAGCGSKWKGPGSCDEYPFASTLQGGYGAQIMGVPGTEQRTQAGEISGFYRRNKIADGRMFLVYVVNVSYHDGE